MSKGRRTRKEKIIAASRRDSVELVDNPSLRQLQENQSNQIPVPESNYAYVSQDIWKTVLIVTIIAALNIVLYIMLKLKIVSLSGIVF